MSARAQPAQMRVVAPREPFAVFVDEAATRFGIPPAWIRAVMRAESVGDARATSPKGAIGLMQIMPETWAELRRHYHLGADPYDAHDNIFAGTAYLRELHDRYGIPGFLAAYNAGPARWEDHLATGRPLPMETRAYLARLAPVVAGGEVDDATLLATVERSWTEASLFPSPSRPPSSSGKNAVGPSSGSASGDRRVADWTGLAPSSNGLFVALSGWSPGR
ncbi:lytic transglycosylase [Acidisphaera rubrifaciens HS-AP3]|uniref:Lytic transglycosylase n=2 Tax=Acidisphaera TaxID=50714 RepID=A0A0D6P238_9PROT|nr:lytic transglycosylase [Acidisphaera rubrifaciens HS-AP3]